MNLIVAVDENWGIGYKGELLFRISEDLKRFATLTKEAGIVVMGRKTFESIGKPLPDRKNIIITRDIKPYNPDYLYLDFDISLNYIHYNKLSDKTFIIGGEQIYKLYLNYCEYAYITKIKSYKKADAYFPNLDKMSNWEIVEESEEYEQDGIKYSFLKYKNLRPKRKKRRIKYGTKTF